ncbi:MAG: SPASM domain-containing protein [Phycisphaeraceae bacterium]
MSLVLIVTDLERGPLGLPSRAGEDVAGEPALVRTVRRAARIDGARRVVLVHPEGQSPLALLAGVDVGRPVETFAVEPGRMRANQRWIAARKWALDCWRGGLGGATVYDELLPAAPLTEAMRHFDASAAVLVGAEWCLFDPELASRQLAMHQDEPEAYKLVFTQAPPGLAAMVTSRAVLEQLAEHHAAFGQAMGYNPRAPRPDPVGQDVNLPIPPEVRDARGRFIFDTPAGAAAVRAIADGLGDRLAQADAAAVVKAWQEGEVAPPALPQQVTLELTPERAVSGPITPQHWVEFDRAAMDAGLAREILAQLGEAGDVALRLGGLGDAMRHPAWRELAQAAREAGVLGIALDTDLVGEPGEALTLLEAGLDAVTVRMNADQAETYRAVMGVDRLPRVTGNLDKLFRQRGGRPTPWLVPRLIKTAKTLGDLERFFDRWMRWAGAAVVEPAQSGCGLMPEQSPVPMAPPLRTPCRQLGQRMTILSDGTVALCDQDWLGREALGNAGEEPLSTIWARARERALAQHAGEPVATATCRRCVEWHRP